ncbi:hypothetical protein HAX54_034221 [Datura stramonium]|uniref:Cupin type-1 domain-containing protein n=1 Tax=Datura stramonium TaxID=4076 RepID=A0ABS8VDL8_DATST|nr:hypothetical protein [Datura stramonium]
MSEGMSIIRPDEEEEEEFEEQQGRPGQQWWEEVIGNGLEENICTMKIRTNIEQRRADIFSRQAGKINHVGRQKLPILNYMDMSASKGTLYPNALMTPHWSVNGHCVIYVRGDAQVQVVDQMGQQVMNDRVNKGERCFEPMNSQLAGYTSVIRAMPVEVLTNAFQISQMKLQRR